MLTRRRARRAATVALLVVGTLGLYGCGGGALSGGGISMRSIAGVVAPPAGSGLSAASLRVVTAAGVATVASNGAFSARNPGAGPALVSACEGSGKPVLLAFFDAGGGRAASAPAIDARSTAVALAFLVMQGYTMPRDTWPRVLQLIEEHDATDALVQTVVQRMAANPRAVGEGDEALLDAAKAAAEAMTGGSGDRSAALAGRRSVGAVDVTVTSRAGTPGLVQVQPTGEISGVRVEPSVDGNGITLTNGYRRHLRFFVYRTGYEDANGQSQAITPWEPVVPATGSPSYIQAVNGYAGLIGTLIEWASGTLAYTPVTVGPIELPVQPSGARRTFYRVIVIGPGWKEGDIEADIPADLRGSSFAQEWKSAYQIMDAVTFFQEVAIPAFLIAVPVEAIGKNVNRELLFEVVADLVRMVGNAYPQFTEQLIVHDYKGALVTFLKCYDSDALRNSILRKLGGAGVLKVGALQITPQLLQSINVVVSTIDKVLSAGDIGLVMTQLAISDRWQMREAETVAAVVRVQPSPAQVKPGDHVALVCTGAAGIVGTKEYAWSTPGAHGFLADDLGHTGESFTSSSPNVRYVADSTAQDGDTDSVQCEVSLRRGSERIPLGEGTAAIQISTSSHAVRLLPAEQNVYKGRTAYLYAEVDPAPPGDWQVRYNWSTAGSKGTLIGPNGAKNNFTTSYTQVTYDAGDSVGSETVNLEAVRLLPGGGTSRLGRSSAVIHVKDPAAAVRKISHMDAKWTLIQTDPVIKWFAAVAVYAVWEIDPNVSGYYITEARPGMQPYVYYKSTRLLLGSDVIGHGCKDNERGIMLAGASALREGVDPPGEYPPSDPVWDGGVVARYNEGWATTVEVTAAD